MPSFTIQTLVDRAKAQADMLDDFVNTATWLAWATVEAQYLDAIIDRTGYIYQETESAITIPQTGSGFTLVNYRAIIGVYEVEQGRYRRLRNSNPWVRDRQSGIGTAAMDKGPAVEFYVSGSGDDMLLTLYPQPTSGTYVVVGLPARTAFASLASTVSYPLGWEELIVLRMARRALLKEESDTRQVEKFAGEVEQKVADDCWNRVMGQSPSVYNTDDVDPPGAYRRQLPMVGDWTFL